MLKSEVLAELDAAYLVVSDARDISTPEEIAAGVRAYMVRVFEESHGAVSPQDVGFYVLDEGGPSEAAYYRAKAGGSSVEGVVTSYLNSQVPDPYLAYNVEHVDENQRCALATVLEFDNPAAPTVLSEKKIIVYKIGANPITHLELV